METSDTRVILITGTSSGLGKLLTLELLKSGNNTVFATMRNPDSEKGKALLEAGGAAGLKGKLHILPLDVTKTEQCKAAVDKVLGMIGRIDVLVNNAGYADICVVEAQPLSKIRAMFDTDVFGLIDMTQRVLPSMRERKKGRIINISS